MAKKEAERSATVTPPTNTVSGPSASVQSDPKSRFVTGSWSTPIELATKTNTHTPTFSIVHKSK
jgi:hypothetical protein